MGGLEEMYRNGQELEVINMRMDGMFPVASVNVTVWSALN